MAMRRPKKMSRSRGTLPAISRLGPGIETVDVRFTPTMGWESGDVLSRTTCGETRSSPWLISWEVGVGTSVDRGLRLARLRRTVAQGEARGDGEMEHFVLAPREGILSEILIPSGGDVCPPLEQRPTKAENAATAKDAAPEDAAPAKVLEEGERSKPLHPDKGLQGSVQAGVAVHAGVSSSCQEAVVVGRLSFCGHPELHGNLCTSCGRRVIAPEEIATGVGEVSAVNGSHSGAIGISKRGIGGACGEGVHGGERDRVAPMTMAKVTMKGGGTLTVSSTAARKMHIDKAERLLSTRRLSLVLDLDNTLLHCSDHPDARRIVVPGVDGIHPIHLPNQQREYYIKLRPGLRRFLAEAATMFEMTIYTAGTSQYADAVAKVLDPDRNLFQGRHFSTCYTPDLGRNTKSLERIFPCGLDMALIVDDRDDVWRGQQANNLLLVRPYKFFMGQRSVPGGPTHDPGVQPPPERQAMEISETSRRPSPAEGTNGNNESHDPESKAAPKSQTKERGSKTESEWKSLVELNSKLQSNSESATESKSESNAEPTPALTVKATLPKNSESISESSSDPKSASEPESVSQLSSVSESKSSSELKSVPGAYSLSEPKSASKPNGKDASHVSNSPPKTSAVESDAPEAMDSYPARKSSPLTTLGVASEDADDDGIVETDDGVERSRGKLSEPGASSEGVRGDSDGDGVGIRAGKSALSAVAGKLGKGAARIQRQRRLALVLQQRREGRFPAQAASQDPNVATGERVLSAVGLCESGNRDNSDKSIKAATSATVGPAGEEQASSLSPAKEDFPDGGEKKDPDPRADPPGKRAELPRPSAVHPPREVAAKENDPQLDCTLETLKAVHAEFFAAENDRGRDRGQRRDVASFLAKVRSRVLKGVRMVFSGVIPVSGAPVDPRTHRLWKLAETHGAIVGNEIDKYTTHVVAVRLGTAKTKKGLRMPGVFVVHLDWLLNSMWHCRREKETMFLLAGHICAGSPPVPPHEHNRHDQHQNKRQNYNKRDGIRTISASNQDARVSTRVLGAECSGTLPSVRPRETSDCVSDTVNTASIDGGVDIVGERPRKRLCESDSKGGLRESTSRRSSAALAAGWGGDDCKDSSSSSSMDEDSSESDLAGLIDELER